MPSPRESLSDFFQRRRWLVVVAGFLVIEVVYVFFVSAGHFTRWPRYTNFVDDLAEGFRAGHLHLIVEPPRSLLAKGNPFDPAWRPLWYWDASLYKDHYYLYWGPVPALLLAGFKTLLRVHGRVGDQVVVFALASVQALAGVALIDRMKRRLFPALPGFFVVLAAAVFAFANPTPYNLARAGVYEAAIVGGHAFLMAGIGFAFDAISAPGRQRSRLALAGICWTLALGCRASIAPAVALLALLTCFLLAPRDANRWRARAQAFRWLATPIAVGGVLLLTYNKLRFDAWLDFGRHYQMTWIAFGSSPAYFPANLWSYAVRPFSVRCTFPYLFSIPDMGRRALPSWLNPASGYIVYEPVVGCLLALPWTWLAPVTAVLGARRLASAGRAGSDASPDVALTWLLSATTVAAVGSFLVPINLFWATMRFLGDAAPALTVAATCAWWLWYARLQNDPARRRLVVAAAVALGLATIAAGLALGFEGQYRHFHQQNPALLDRLEKAFSFC
jgi:hypothetical protein